MRNESPVQLQYNGTSLQRAAILSRLEKGNATGAQLQLECNAPDPTARIHELRTQGHDIETAWIDQVNPDGSINSVGLYVLRVKDTRQSELFTTP
jgi:hypothetical protein